MFLVFETTNIENNLIFTKIENYNADITWMMRKTWLWGFCGEKIIIGIGEIGIILQVSALFPFLSVLITGEEWKTVPKVFIWEEMWL